MNRKGSRSCGGFRSLVLKKRDSQNPNLVPIPIWSVSPSLWRPVDLLIVSSVVVLVDHQRWHDEELCRLCGFKTQTYLNGSF